jgi:hypothetical protein
VQREDHRNTLDGKALQKTPVLAMPKRKCAAGAPKLRQNLIKGIKNVKFHRLWQFSAPRVRIPLIKDIATLSFKQYKKRRNIEVQAGHRVEIR